MNRQSRTASRRPSTGVTSVCALAALVVLIVAMALAALADVAPANPGTTPGESQSPIDIRRADVTFKDHLKPIRFSYPHASDVEVVNTGSPDEEATVRANVPAGAAWIALGGTRYDLLQFHWHTPSEHEFGGHRSPMEMHLVHSAADGSLLVIGVLIDQGRANETLEPIFEDLPETSGATRAVAGVHIDDLLPGDLRSYRYSGSLTTPPFTEGVRWIVLAHPITLSKHQIHAFQELFEEGNSREVQPLNGRRIVSDAGKRHGGEAR